MEGISLRCFYRHVYNTRVCVFKVPTHRSGETFSTIHATKVQNRNNSMVESLGLSTVLRKSTVLPFDGNCISPLVLAFVAVP